VKYIEMVEYLEMQANCEVIAAWFRIPDLHLFLKMSKENLAGIPPDQRAKSKRAQELKNYVKMVYEAHKAGNYEEFG
jgi:hypothetical protein